MTNKNINRATDMFNIRLAVTLLLVFVIAISNLNGFALYIEVEMEKIENLAEGESRHRL